MKLGMLLPHRAVVLASARRPPLEQCWTTARLCDQAGMDLWVGDSIVAKPRLEPLTTLAHTGQLMAFEHTGFWQPMDTLREKNQLERLWETGHAPWKVW